MTHAAHTPHAHTSHVSVSLVHLLSLAACCTDNTGLQVQLPPVHSDNAALHETAACRMSLEALLTAPQARQIACRYQKQAAELTSPDGGLRRRTSQVKAWHPILPPGSSATFHDSPPAHEARRLCLPQGGRTGKSDPLRHSFVGILTHFGAGGPLRHSTKS